MTPYILSLCVASLAAAVVELLVPRGDGGRMVTHVRMIAGLFLLVALLGPLKTGVDYLRALAEGDASSILSDDLLADTDADASADYESALYASLTATTEAELVAFVEGKLASEFDIPPEHTSISVATTPPTADTPLTLTELRIGLSAGSALRDPHPIEDYFEELLGGVCHVTVGEPSIFQPKEPSCPTTIPPPPKNA